MRGGVWFPWIYDCEMFSNYCVKILFYITQTIISAEYINVATPNLFVVDLKL